VSASLRECQYLSVVLNVKGPTVTARVQVDYRPYADVYDAEEALVLLLELLLVKDLYREDALFVDLPDGGVSIARAWRRLSRHDVHVEALVPVGVQRLLDDARGARLLAIDRGHGEGVRETCESQCERYIIIYHETDGTYGTHRACRGRRRR
jgi:hypothetical protein